MSWRESGKGNAINLVPDAVPNSIVDPALEQALGNFRQSVHAWSEAAYSHPRTVAGVAVHRSWRLAIGSALGCVLAAGSLGGLYEHHHRQVIARMKADQQTRQRQLAIQQRARNADEDLLATVDNDVSRVVPAAMEPLAQLMDGDGDQ